MTKCELCGNNPANSLSYFGDRASRKPNGEWKLTCFCSTLSESYNIGLSSYDLNSLEWLWRLAKNPWFDQDDFMACLKRLP